MAGNALRALRSILSPATVGIAVLPLTALLAACSGDDDGMPAPSVTAAPPAPSSAEVAVEDDDATAASSCQAGAGELKSSTIRSVQPDTLRLTHSAFNAFPVWSPDGRRIAFVSDRDHEGNLDLYVMNADGSDVERLTHSDAWELSLTWSPDARRIAFTSASFSDGDWGIYVMNADGSGVERLTSPLTEAAYPAWSPDGQRIAFSSNPDGHMEIYAMNADGSGVERLTSCSDAVSSSPAWSPDGQRIAFARTVRDRRTALWRPGEWDIYVMNADGSDAERLTYFGFKSTFPAWSPDGRRIAFESDIGINSEIYMMNADGSDIVGLTDSAGSASPAWSPDGRRIAFLSDVDGNGNTDIHVITLPSP